MKRLKSHNFKFPFRIGCDPELGLQLNNKMVDTGFLYDYEIFKIFQTTTWGDIGSDGGLIELRPSPSHNIPELIRNIKNMLQNIYDKAYLFEINPLSKHRWPLGGHVHLELPAGKDYTFGDQLPNNLINAMTTFMIPIILTQTQKGMQHRNQTGYGKIGDYRCERKGHNRHTLELRAPSAEWITTPKIAEAVFSYLAVIFYEFIHNSKSLKDHEDIFLKKQEHPLVNQLTSKPEIALTRIVHREIKRKVKKFKLYKPFKSLINYLFNYKLILKDKQKANYDIAVGWNLQKPNGKLDPSVEISPTYQIDAIKALMQRTHGPFLWNDGLKMYDFMEQLVQTCLATKWKPEGRYLFFGFKKAIPGFVVSSTDLRGKPIVGEKLVKETEFGEEIMATLTRLKKRFKDQKNLILFGIPYKVRLEKKFNLFVDILKYVDYIQGKKYIKLSERKLQQLTEKGDTKQCVESSSQKASKATQ